MSGGQRGKISSKVRKRDALLQLLAEISGSTLYLMALHMLYGFTLLTVYTIAVHGYSTDIAVILTFISSALLLIYAGLVYQTRVSQIIDGLFKYSKLKYGLPARMLRVGYLWSPLTLFVASILLFFTDKWLYTVLLSIALMAVGMAGLAVLSLKLYSEFKLKAFELSSVFSASSIPSLLLYPYAWPAISSASLLLLYTASRKLYESVASGVVKVG